MAYTSKAAMVTAWGSNEVTRSADRDPVDGISEDAAIAAACAQAISLVDSYLVQAGIDLPIADPAPEVLTLRSTDIAMYFLSQGIETLTEEKRKRYDDAIAWLKALVAGKADLPGLPGLPDAATPTRRVRGTGLANQYTAAKLRGTGGLL
jgi:phage gp36-like protein